MLHPSRMQGVALNLPLVRVLACRSLSHELDENESRVCSSNYGDWTRWPSGFNATRTHRLQEAGAADPTQRQRNVLDMEALLPRSPGPAKPVQSTTLLIWSDQPE